MASPGCQKKEKNRRRQVTTAEWRLQELAREQMRTWRGEDGDPPSRAIRRVIYNEQNPVGMLGRRCVEARAKKMPLEQVEELIDVIRDWVRNDLYGQGKGQRIAS